MVIPLVTMVTPLVVMLATGLRPRMVKELTTKLQAFQGKFDELLSLQANSLQLEHEPSQSETQPQNPWGKICLEFCKTIYFLLRQEKTTLRKLLVDLSKEDVQLNQIVTRCRLGSDLFLPSLFLPLASLPSWHGWQGSEGESTCQAEGGIQQASQKTEGAC